MSRVSSPMLFAVLFAIVAAKASEGVHGWRFHVLTLALVGMWLAGIAEGRRP